MLFANGPPRQNRRIIQTIGQHSWCTSRKVTWVAVTSLQGIIFLSRKIFLSWLLLYRMSRSGWRMLPWRSKHYQNLWSTLQLEMVARIPIGGTNLRLAKHQSPKELEDRVQKPLRAAARTWPPSQISNWCHDRCRLYRVAHALPCFAAIELVKPLPYTLF